MPNKNIGKRLAIVPYNGVIWHKTYLFSVQMVLSTMIYTRILSTARSFKLNAIKILWVRTFNHPYEISNIFLITSKWLFSPGQLFGMHYLSWDKMNDSIKEFAVVKKWYNNLKMLWIIIIITLIFWPWILYLISSNIYCNAWSTYSSKNVHNLN